MEKCKHGYETCEDCGANEMQAEIDRLRAELELSEAMMGEMIDDHTDCAERADALIDKLKDENAKFRETLEEISKDVCRCPKVGEIDRDGQGGRVLEIVKPCYPCRARNATRS